MEEQPIKDNRHDSRAGDRNLWGRIFLIWLAIIPLFAFWASGQGDSDHLGLSAAPQVPRQDEPLLVTFKLSNPSAETLTARYRFFINGALVSAGSADLPPQDATYYQYAYANPLPLGRQVNLLVETQSPLGEAKELLSLPPYPPQIWSSFSSFASFSSSLMGSLTSMSYFTSTFGTEGINLGFLFTVILAALLVFGELTSPLAIRRPLPMLERLRQRWGAVAAILFIVFMGVVYTRLVFIFSTI